MSNLENKEIMAKNIQYYMDKYEKSRQDMCEALGVKYTTLTDWVKGNSYPRIDKIELMANYFGISKADLIEEHADKPILNKFLIDPDIRRIQRAREKMSEQEKNKMMKILEASFDDYFGDDFIDEDND